MSRSDPAVERLPLHSLSAGVLLPVISTVLFVLLVIRLGWTGHIESDDVFYAQAAMGWVEHFPYLAQTHWGLRHTVVLPLALSFWLFGQTEAALEAPILLYYAALLVLTAYCVGRVGGLRAALLATVLVAATPIIASESSTIGDDLTEAFFVLASLWAFFFAVEARDRRISVLSGIAAGFGFLTRETTVALLVLYGVLFLAGYGRDRWAYVWMAAGFLLVVGLDAVALAWASGDPLYRLHVSLAKVAQVDSSGGTKGFEAVQNLSKPRWLLPFLVTFGHPSFGLLYWLGVPAAIVMASWPNDDPERRMARLLGGLALVWFLVLGYAVPSALYVLPRLQIVSAACLAMLLGVALLRLADAGRAALATGAAVVVLVSNLLLIAATPKNPLFGERALTGFVAANPGPVYTDPGTKMGARWLLSSAGLTARVEVEVPPAGALYFYDPTSRRGLPSTWPIQKPAPDWRLVARYTEAPTWIARVLRASGLERDMPRSVVAKLDPPVRVASLWRVPAQDQPSAR